MFSVGGKLVNINSVLSNSIVTTSNQRKTNRLSETHQTSFSTNGQTTFLKTDYYTAFVLISLTNQIATKKIKSKYNIQKAWLLVIPVATTRRLNLYTAALTPSRKTLKNTGL